MKVEVITQSQYELSTLALTCHSMSPQNWCEPKSSSKLVNRRTKISARLILCRQLLKPVHVVRSDGLLQGQSWSH